MSEIALPATDVETRREPEKLVIPPGAVMWLLMKALSTPEGDAWMRGFVTAHGEPSWIVNNQWGIRSGEADIVQVERQNGQMR
jgi:virulence-associated protein VagC